MYVLAPNQIVEKFPYSIGDLRKDNPQTSFPKDPNQKLLESFGIYPVVSTSVQIDALTQKAVQEGCHYNEEKNRWETSWTVVDLSKEEIQNNKDAEATRVRSKRDGLLAETDWVVTKAVEIGETVPANWATYRQSLRDISKQVGFPYSVVWPTKPE